jgi:hypothetical protein
MKPLLLLLLSLTLLSPVTFLTTELRAQPSAVVHGAVTDESGAVIPGAKVTVSNAAGAVKSGTSGDDGNYSITGLAPGQYSVQATSPGLQQVKPFAIDLTASPTATANLQLQVAAEKQEVTVQENPGPAISVDPAQNAGALVLRGADLQALSDDPDDLQADLQALAGPSAGPSGGQIYIDGFTGGQLPSKDSIREIRINQNPFSAEYDKLGYGLSPAPTSCTETSTSTSAMPSGMRVTPTPPKKHLSCSGILAGLSATLSARRRLSLWMCSIATSTMETSSTALVPRQGSRLPALSTASSQLPRPVFKSARASIISSAKTTRSPRATHTTVTILTTRARAI